MEQRNTTRRVLHIANQISDRGDGIANVCVDIACEQAERGYSIGIASADGGFVPLIKANGVEHFEIRLRKNEPLSLVGAVGRLRQIVREFTPDLVHSHTITSTVIARIACFGTGVPVVATVHNEYQRGVGLMGTANHVVGVSEAVSSAMERRKIPRRKISTVLNGTVGSIRRKIDVATITVPILAEQSIVAIGAVSQRKGADILIAAFGLIAQRFPAADLYFVGNVDCSEVSELAARTSAGDRIHFVGFSAQPQVYLHAASVFALASRRDPFPLALLEALEAGIPIVACGVDGVPEALDGGVAGMLVPANDPEALASGIARMLESTSLREQYSAAGRQRSTQFSVSRMVDDYATAYSRLLARWR